MLQYSYMRMHAVFVRNTGFFMIQHGLTVREAAGPAERTKSRHRVQAPMERRPPGLQKHLCGEEI